MRQLREEAHITQEKLAWECGFAKGFLSQVEAGTSVPSVAALFVLARRLGVDPIHLLAVDARKPLHRLVDAVRRRNRLAADQQLDHLFEERGPFPASHRQAAEAAHVPRVRRGSSRK